MSWLLGAGFGFLRGGPLGAVIGGVTQHVVSKKFQKLVRKSLPGVKNEPVFVTCVIVVMTKIAMIKGTVRPREVETIYRFFVRNLNYREGDFEGINRVIREVYGLNPDLKPVVKQYKQATESKYRSLLLTLAYQVALVEDSLTEGTQKEINELARLLDLSHETHNAIREKLSLDDLVTPYGVLGVPVSATDEEIKKAYRRLASLYHPDRVAHRGGEEVEQAHIRFLQLQDAYREIGLIRRF
ncbi:DnaJ domain-containing protein [Nitrospina watsonii]|uniref:DnaJ-like protein DjlA n=1 Tax=Nitrospina watsonii TaxID=1323948 RepID=A0ABN8W5B8_9BACT|nr:DnaJ domain-containing protein [Nitrospina watsonii]CAI2718548.1 DnaJ-like protein DjlA [Nitrospina watsonii]